MFGQDLRKIDLDKKNVYMKKKEFNLGVAAELKALQRRDLAKKEAVTSFLDNVHSSVVAILKKMLEKSPIGSVVVRNASVFNPDSISVTKEDLKNLKHLQQHFFKIKVLTASHADKASIQCGEFLKNDMKLVNKDDNINRLDDFYFTKLNVGKKYPELTNVAIIILTLSHGQAYIERRFSQNKTG